MTRAQIFEQLRALPEGSIVTSPLPSTEGNVAEKASDGWWLVTGEIDLFSLDDLTDFADAEFTVLRNGYEGQSPYVPATQALAAQRTLLITNMMNTDNYYLRADIQRRIDALDYALSIIARSTDDSTNHPKGAAHVASIA